MIRSTTRAALDLESFALPHLLLPSGSIAAESVQEVQVSGPPGVGGWLDAHVVAGVVSALLLAAALIICVCVAVRRRRYGGYR